MAGEVLVDALPYIDQGYVEQDVREAALSLVEEECRRYRPTKNYLEHLPQLNIHLHETDLMKNEFERIQNRLPMDQLSMKRYELPPPVPGKLSEITAWAESVDNSMAQLEHQATRALNLELMLEYCCETWKEYLEIFTSLEAKAEIELQNLKKSIQEINWQRKTKQKEAGDKLRLLEAQWVMLVSKNYEIEQACADLETKIYEMKTQLKISVDEDKEEDEVTTITTNGFEVLEIRGELEDDDGQMINEDEEQQIQLENEHMEGAVAPPTENSENIVQEVVNDNAKDESEEKMETE